jgi:hypothetical protein
MINTRYVVIQTVENGASFVENNMSYDEYHTAIELRDLKRKIENIEKKGYQYNVASFNIINFKTK